MAFRNLTNVGKEYLATRLANELPVKFIKAKIGNGSVPLLVNPADTKDLYNFKKEVTIIEAVQEQNSIKLTLQVTNNEILEGFYLKEIGIYVDDNGKEVLYWYCNEDNSQYINAQTDVPLSFEIDIMMEVTNINSTVIEWAGKENWISKNYFDEKVRTFEIPTIAELQSRKNLKVGDIVEVLGYYTAGDGAGHKRIIANEDDGSGVQLKNGLWANIVHNGEVNIKWLGAKGDGVTDDTNAFNTQFNLFAPAGTFLINNTIKMQSGNSLRGENMYDSIIKVGSDVDGIWVNTDCTLKNLGFNSDLETYNSDVIKIGDETFTKASKLYSMCGVKVNNISSDFKMQNGTGIFCHILFSSKKINGENQAMVGYWGLKINHIRCRGYYDRVFKVESKNYNAYNSSGSGWLTYSEVNDVKSYMAITAIESVATYDTGTYDDSTNHPVCELQFKDCNFESHLKTKNAFISNGLPIYMDNVIAGDYHLSLQNYAMYKIYYYKKLSFYGDFIIYQSQLNSFIELSKKIEVVGYKGDLHGFIQRNCNIKSIDRLNDRSTLSIPEVKQYNVNDYFVDKPQLCWIYSYSKKEESYLEFLANFSAYGFGDSTMSSIEARFRYDFSTPSTPMIVTVRDIHYLPIRFVYEENENEIKIGYVSLKEDSNMLLPIRRTFGITYGKTGLYLLFENPIEITTEQYELLKKVDVKYTGLISTNKLDINNISGGNFIINPTKNTLGTIISGQYYEVALSPSPVSQLNTIYHLEKMKQENVYSDYITYMDDKTLYDKQQRNLEKQRQVAYQEALKENPNLSYEEFMSVQPTNLNLVEEPQPSQALKQFMEKYL